MHGSVVAPHVDHLHPDAGIALATAVGRRGADQGVLRGPGGVDPVAATGVPARAGDPAIARAHPEAIGVILGGHGITAWGATSEQCEARSLEIIGTAQAFLDARGRAEPLAPSCPASTPCPPAERRARAAALAPVIRGLASTDHPQVGHFTDTDVGPRLLPPREVVPPRRPGHVVPGPLPADQGAPARRRPGRRRLRWTKSWPGCTSSTPPTGPTTGCTT